MKGHRFKPNRVRVWRVSDRHDLHPPAPFQYMNPASHGAGVKEGDSSLYYSSSENWNKKRVKNSKSSNRSSGRGNSAQAEKSDDNFINELLCKNEDVENQSSNVGRQGQNLIELWGNKRIEQSLSKFSSHLILPANIEEVPENNNLRNLSVDNIKLSTGNKGSSKTVGLRNAALDDDFVEEIIEDVNENKSDDDDVVDEVGEVEMPKMGETGNKFNEIILSDDEFDSVVIEDKEKAIQETANKFEQKVAKFTSSYEYKNKTVHERNRMPIKDTIEDDEIKEEINVEDDSEEESPNAKLRQRFLDRLANNRTMVGKKSHQKLKIKRGSPSQKFLESKGREPIPKIKKESIVLPSVNRRNTNMIELECDAIDDSSDSDSISKEPSYF